LNFDEYNDVYATNISVDWYFNENIILSKNFYPENSSFFCDGEVENCNKIIIKIFSINMPFNRLKLRSIEYGHEIVFGADEFSKIKFMQEISPISNQISINTVDFNLKTHRNINPSFQEKQQIEVFEDDNFLSKTFIKSSKQKGKKEWEISILMVSLWNWVFRLPCTSSVC
jgi:hypothetical protein